MLFRSVERHFNMVPWNYPLVCALFLATSTFYFAVSSGSLMTTSTYKQTNEEIDPREYGATYKREGFSDAIEYVATAGVITRNGSIAFDSDYIEYNQTTRLNCE